MKDHTTFWQRSLRQSAPIFNCPVDIILTKSAPSERIILVQWSPATSIPKLQEYAIKPSVVKGALSSLCMSWLCTSAHVVRAACTLHGREYLRAEVQSDGTATVGEGKLP